MNGQRFSLHTDGRADASRSVSYVEMLIVASALKAHERFLERHSFDVLRAKDPDLAARFDEQTALFRHAREHGDKDDIKRQGDALLRGYEAITERMQASAIDLNKARLQKGTVPHPGRPPVPGTAARRKWYATYLETAEWASRRDKVLARANERCEGCGSADATQVHHLTYQHVGFEFLFELIAICPACHARLHGKAPP